MISIVIPILNEAETIPALHERLLECSKYWSTDFEVVFVDDGSTDDSPQLMDELVTNDPRFRVVRLSRNFGHQAAITAGMSQAKGDALVVMDGDLQDPPEVITRLLEQWRAGFQVVYAIRKKRKEGIAKRQAYALFYRLLGLVSETDIPADSGDFCLMDKRVYNVLSQDMPENNRFVRGLRAYAGFRQVGVEYDREERKAGKAKYNFLSLTKLALDGLFDFSIVPLRIASIIGVSISLVSFLLGLFFVFHRLLDFKILGYSPADVPGMASMIVALFFLSGILLMILGIIGEYIGRIYIEVKKRPMYIIAGVIEHPSKSDADHSRSETST